MIQYNSSEFFEYWDEAPQDWYALLKNRVDKGDTKIKIPVLWGVHEQSPGIRDFSKQSRFRIEKLFAAAQDLKIQVDLVLGFPPHSQSYPSWVGESKSTEEVPEVLWTNTPPYFSTISLPSLRSAKTKEAFFSFVEEVDSILSLYIAPEGPIANVYVDLTPLEVSQSLMADPTYIEKLRSRYPDIQSFNRIFQTHYKDLSSVTTSTGFKVAEGKRPWLLAYDYHWCREQMVEAYFKELINHHISDRVRVVVKRGAKTGLELQSSEIKLAICFENALIQEQQNNRLGPLVLGERVANSCLQAFQWGQLASQVAREEGAAFFTASKLLEANPGLGVRQLVVLSGKYMAAAQVKALIERLNKGHHLFFPMGLPQFDENLNSHPFVSLGAKTTVEIDGVPWFFVKQGLGACYFPVKTGAITNANELQSLVRWLKLELGDGNRG